MSEENKPENEELKIKFEEDGKEYVVNDMPDNAKELYIRWQEKIKIRDNFIVKANNDIDDLNRIMTSYKDDMQNILEPKEEKKIEVSK
jgi:hypothetical protein